MIKVGLTGGIGSGKSTAGRIFRMLGIPVYDSDIMAKAIMNSDPQVISQIKDIFGPRAYNRAGLDRKYVAAKVFSDPAKLEQLNSVVHPAVGKDFNTWAAGQTSHYVIEESAILFESGAYRKMDITIAVAAPENIRVKRVTARDAMTESDVKARMANQMSDAERTSRANYTLTADEKNLLIPQIIDLHSKLISL